MSLNTNIYQAVVQLEKSLPKGQSATHADVIETAVDREAGQLSTRAGGVNGRDFVSMRRAELRNHVRHSAAYEPVKKLVNSEHARKPADQISKAVPEHTEALRIVDGWLS